MLFAASSVARGEDGEGSDFDLLVRFKKPVVLIELIRIEDRFEAAFGRQVDLGTEGSLHPLIRDNVMEICRFCMKARNDKLYLFEIYTNFAD
ncbi:MAG: nucleotidyltransferase domain-containing protein [Pyrinomonadaceae bacterium]